MGRQINDETMAVKYYALRSPVGFSSHPAAQRVWILVYA